MPLSEKEKTYIVDTVVEILRSPQREERIAALREKVLDDEAEERNPLDDAIYSVVQAVVELND